MKLRLLGALTLLSCALAGAAPNGMGSQPQRRTGKLIDVSSRPAPILTLLKVGDDEVLSGDLEGRVVRHAFGSRTEATPVTLIGGAVLQLVKHGERVLAVDDLGAVWEVAAEPTQLALHPGGAHALAVSPSGELLAPAGADGTIRLWDASGEAKGVLEGHEGPVVGVAFDPTKPERMFSVGHDATVRSWKLSGGNGSKPYRGKDKEEQEGKRELSGLAISSTGEHLVSCSYDGTVVLWEVEKRKLTPSPLPQRSYAELAQQVAFSPEGKRAVAVLSGESALLVFDVDSPRSPLRIERGLDAPASATFLDESTLVVGGYAGKLARLPIGGSQ